MRILHIMAATGAVGAMAVPAAAQTYYPQQQPQYQYPQAQPQPYPGQPGYAYQQQGYAQPGYAYPGQQATNPIEAIIGQLLGNRYNVSDRTLVSRCATAAVAQAQRQYPRQAGYAQPYGNAYGHNQPNNPHYGYNNAAAQMRVTAITDVQRRSGNRGLRVTGQMSSGMHAMAYGQQGYGQQGYGYQGQRRIDPRYAQAADLSFRCNVDARGNVSGIRVSQNRTAYRR